VQVTDCIVLYITRNQLPTMNRGLPVIICQWKNINKVSNYKSYVPVVQWMSATEHHLPQRAQFNQSRRHCRSIF